MKNKDKKTTKFTAKIKQSASHYGMSYKRKMQTKLYTLFRTRGGSFYGIGYIITLLFHEAA